MPRTLRLYLAFGLILCSYVLLIPGLLQPFMSLVVEVKVLSFNARLMDETRSLWGTAMALYGDGHQLVAVLILTFSTLVPVLKGVLLMLWYFLPMPLWSQRCYWVYQGLSKWSMADVFVAGVIISFLAMQAEQHVQATLLEGFYFFLGFCLLSVLSAQLLPPCESASPPQG